jgi:hypothetical protein
MVTLAIAPLPFGSAQATPPVLLQAQLRPGRSTAGTTTIREHMRPMEANGAGARDASIPSGKISSQRVR